MGENKRRGEPAIPSNVESLLTSDQASALPSLKGFGWSLLVVRRPKFEPVEVVLEHKSGKFAYLNESGELDHAAGLRVRTVDKEPKEEPEEDTEVVWSRPDDGEEFSIPELVSDSGTVNNEPIPKPGNGGGKPPKKILV